MLTYSRYNMSKKNDNVVCIDVVEECKKKPKDEVVKQFSGVLSSLSSFKSQITIEEGPRSLKAIESLAQFRGSQAGFSYGEAFYVIRQIL